MAASEARILANRENAKHSTGPRTEAGKLQSRRNALRHGLSGDGTVLLPEDEAKLSERRVSWGRVLRPTDEVEAFLVEQAVVHSVKLERASAVESASVFAAVERADDGYEAEVLGRLEAAEAEVRAWERLGADMTGRGTIVRDRYETLFQLLGVDEDDGRRIDLVALARAASSSEGTNEAARVAARESLGDLIGSRLAERRRAVARIFEEIDGTDGLKLARAKAALDVGPAGLLARRYEETEERGLMRMLDGLDRRRKAAEKSTRDPDSTHSLRQPDQPGALGKLPNEPNGLEIAEQSSGSGNLDQLPNEPNRGVIRVAGVVPTPIGPDVAHETGVGMTPAAPGKMDRPGGLGNLPIKSYEPKIGERSGDPGNLDQLPNEPKDGVSEVSGRNHPPRIDEGRTPRIGEQIGDARSLRPAADDERRVA